MYRRICIRLLISTFCILVAVAPSSGEGDALDRLRDTALSFFVPLKGLVSTVRGGVITTKLGKKSGIRPGMRLRVFRKGDAFLHPITKEAIGQAERLVGTAEVVKVGSGGSRLKVIRGKVRRGDILRLSSGKIAAMFYQSAGVDWNISEEYYHRLKATGRFDLMETPPGTATEREIIEEAGRLKAEVAIILTPASQAPNSVFTQRLLWVEDAAELSREEANIDEAALRELKFGGKYFSPVGGSPALALTLPFAARLLAAGDLDGDGRKELILSNGAVLKPYTVGAKLRPALNGLKLKDNSFSEHIWLETADLDGDGRDEVIISAVGKGDVSSRIYGYGDGEFSVLWEGPIFARVIDGRLYGQRHAGASGYDGRVFPVQWKTGGAAEAAASPGLNITLPEGINIYDFNYLASPGGGHYLVAYDDKGRLNVYGSGGPLKWQSNGDYGGIARYFGNEASPEFEQTEKWRISHRILIRGATALALKRVPAAGGRLRGQYKDPQMIGLYSGEGGLREAVLLDGLEGDILDYAQTDDRLFILAGTHTISPLSLLKGQGLFSTKLYVYSLRGK